MKLAKTISSSSSCCTSDHLKSIAFSSFQNQFLLSKLNTRNKKFDDILSIFDREWKFSRLRNHRKNQFSRFRFFNGEIHFGYFDFRMWLLNFQLVFNFWCWALYRQIFYCEYQLILSLLHHFPSNYCYTFD